MADKKSEVSSSTSPALSANLTAEMANPADASAHPTSEADTFLSAKDAKASIKKMPTPNAEAMASTNVPNIVRRGGIGFMTALLMSTLAAGGGAYLALFAQSRPDLIQKAGISAFVPTTAPAVQAGAGGTNLTPLTTRVSALEGQLLELQNRLGVVSQPPTPPVENGNVAPTNSISPPPLGVVPNANPGAPQNNSADMGIMKSELQGISGRVTAIETRLAALDPTGASGAVVAGLQADIASLKSIIASLQQQAASAPSPAVTFALINVAEAANRSGPFMVEFETLRAAMPGIAEVAALEPFARSGVPTRQVLEERFAALGPAVAAAVAADKKESGLVAWVRSLFSDMVKVQPAPDTNAIGSNGSIDRAKAKLDQGDYNSTIEELSAIVGPPLAVIDWISGAKRRLELESRISAVRGAAARVPSSASALAPVGVPLIAPQTPLITGQIPGLTGFSPAAPAPNSAPKTQGQNP